VPGCAGVPAVQARDPARGRRVSAPPAGISLRVAAPRVERTPTRYSSGMGSSRVVLPLRIRRLRPLSWPRATRAQRRDDRSAARSFTTYITRSSPEYSWMCSAAKVRANAAIGLRIRIRTPVGRRGSDGSAPRGRAPGLPHPRNPGPVRSTQSGRSCSLERVVLERDLEPGSSRKRSQRSPSDITGVPDGGYRCLRNGSPPCTVGRVRYLRRQF
jgi:hypothetical protein